VIRNPRVTPSPEGQTLFETSSFPQLWRERDRLTFVKKTLADRPERLDSSSCVDLSVRMNARAHRQLGDRFRSLHDRTNTTTLRFNFNTRVSLV